MPRSRFVLPLLLLLILETLNAFGQLRTTAKTSCTPCEDYYGIGAWPPAAQTLVIADTIPGRFLLIHIEDPDTNTWFIEGDFYIDINNYVTVQSGDTAVFQFSQNGTYVINFQGAYGVPNGLQCDHYGDVTIVVTGLPMTAANESVVTSTVPKISAFPNPTNGLLHVEWQGKAAVKSTANLFGTQAQRIRSGLPFVNGKLDIDLSELPSGIYHLTFSGPTTLNPLTIVKY